MQLSNNLEYLMRLHGNITLSELARLTDIPQPTLHHILMGASKNPRKKSLESLCKFFSVTKEQLLGHTPLPTIIPENIKENLKIKTIPIIDWGMLKTWPKQEREHSNLKEILLNKKVGDHSFALVVQDTSMEPLFPLNALLVFDTDKESLDRDFVITHLKRDDIVLFNRLFVENNEKFIKQNLENGDAKLIKLDSTSDRIIGTLVEVRIQF